MKQLLLIVNPAAGTKKAAKSLSEIISVFNKADFDVHVYITSQKDDAVKAVKIFGGSADLIVTCGGDGTLNETVTGLIESDMYVPLGYIPAGSTNDFANSLKLSSNVIKAANQIINGIPHEYDVGKFGSRYFTYVASFGAFTKTSYKTPQNIKNTLGHTAYILEGIQELSNIRKERIRIEMNDEVLEEDYLFGAVCNSTSVGGLLKLSSKVVDMCDGKFEVFLVRAPKDIQELGECIVALTNQKYDCNMITFRSTSSLKVYASPDIPWSIDGEKAQGAETIEIENISKRITIIH